MSRSLGKQMSEDRRRPRVQRHHEVTAAVVKNFFPKWGHDSQLLHVRGESQYRGGIYIEELARLGLRNVLRRELPDIVAYSKQKNRLYLIEAVHTSGPISQTRLSELKRLTNHCTADMVFVTAFLDRDTFRKFAPEIAWETVVWLADAPGHMIHFNGGRLLGSH
jgi:hypothetical protein